MAKVPFLLVFITQLASVIGDGTGQRCSRVYHKRNRRRFLISMVGVTCLQMFACLLFVQVALPSTAEELHQKVNGTIVDVCKLPEGDPHRPSEACYAQGPLTIYKAVGYCPMLLVNGLMNVLYYFGEATMYREPLGVMLIVMCALMSTFIVAPMQTWLGMGSSNIPGAGAIVFGIVGALLCSVERKVPQAAAAIADASSAELLSDEDGDDATLADDGTPRQRPRPPGGSLTESDARLDRTRRNCQRWLRFAHRLFPLLLPFLGLSFTYALYFCLMQYYDEICNANPWGYNSVDQVGLPLYMYPAIIIGGFVSARCTKRSSDAAAPLNAAPESLDDGNHVAQPGTNVITAMPPPQPGAEHSIVGSPVAAIAGQDTDDDANFWEAVKHSVREDAANYGQGFFFMFAYRLFINGRAISYFFIAVEYDLSEAYFVLTLVRVLLSWVVSLALVLAVPRYIHAAADERAQLLDKVNLAAKGIGSLCVLLSLLFINGTI
jgi:hypothetical protein